MYKIYSTKNSKWRTDSEKARSHMKQGCPMQKDFCKMGALMYRFSEIISLQARTILMEGFLAGKNSILVRLIKTFLFQLSMPYFLFEQKHIPRNPGSWHINSSSVAVKEKDTTEKCHLNNI